MQANFTGQSTLAGGTGKGKICPRCARPGVRVTDPNFEVWNCPFGHGEIHRSALPKEEPEDATEDAGEAEISNAIAEQPTADVFSAEELAAGAVIQAKVQLLNEKQDDPSLPAEERHAATAELERFRSSIQPEPKLEPLQ
jgi:hypothetical protein